MLGGGEFSFGQTQDTDRVWLAKVPEGAKVGFVPAASGSIEYGEHFTGYLRETFERQAESLPIYRARDAKRGKNSRRIAECGAIYLGGGVVDHLIDAFLETPAAVALAEKLRDGGVIVAIAAAASFLGCKTRSLLKQEISSGLGWLVDGVVVANFDPRDERHLRELVEDSSLPSVRVRWGVGIPAGSALLLGPNGERETVGEIYLLDGPDGEIKKL